MQVTNNTDIKINGMTIRTQKTVPEDSFNNYIQENQTKKKDKEDENSQAVKKEDSNTKTEDLVKDILSLLRTGFTVSELEELEELLKKLQDKIKEGNYTEEEVEALLSNVEKAIAEMKKKLTGEAIIEAGADNIKQEDSKTKKNEMDNFLERINKAITQLETFKKASVYKEEPANESEILSMIKEFSKKA